MGMIIFVVQLKSVTYVW